MEVRAGYKQTVLGALPNDWVVSSVGKSFEVLNHLRLPISQSEREKISGPYPYFGPTSVQGWIHDYRVEGTHALIGEDGDHFLKWSSHPMTLLVDGKFNVNNHAHVVKGVTNETSWFYWYFLHRDLTAFLTRQGASRYKLTKAVLLDLPCVIPPQKEQQAIANVLSDVDTLIAGLETLIAKKRDLKQAAMQQLLTGQTRLPGFSGDWVRNDLKNLVSTPITDGPHLTPTFYETGVPFLSVNNLANNRIDWSDLRFISKADDEIFSRKCKPLKGDVLLGKAASVGKVAIVEDDFDFNIWSPIALIRAGEKVNGKFLYYQLLSADCITQVLLLTNSSSQGNIGMGDIEKLQISYPCYEEQMAIAKVLADMDAELGSLETRLVKTRELKQGMMQELLTGRTRLL
jgi:type I restriction enzyme S subunit